ncbi:MAG: cysteine desulfurase NifS [Clostridia bacterium]|nr:cysteine desulfurase NifS [Clostridia bacterium]
MEKVIYVDHSATTYVKEEVIEEMLPYFNLKYGNASSVYSVGRKSRQAVDEARQKVADALNCGSDEIYFTAGGSESDNLIISGIARANREKGNHIITTKIEHLAVLNTCKKLEEEGFEVTYLDVNKHGLININDLQNAIKDSTILISIMFANNEIGTIQPIEEIGNIAKFKNVYFHTDAVQAIGNIKIDVKQMNIDALSLSGHKFYGPKGIGAAYIKKDIKFYPLIYGGHQEKNKRAGTENVPGIVGLGKAIEIANKNIDAYNEKLNMLRQYCIDKIFENISDVKLNGHPEKRLPGNINISIKGVEGESLLLMLDMNNICASSGSACTSGSLEPSHVLVAIGLGKDNAYGSLRFTFGEENTKEDVDYIVDKLTEIVNKLRLKG